MRIKLAAKTLWPHICALSILLRCLPPSRRWSGKPNTWLVPKFCLPWLERPIVTSDFGFRIILFVCATGNFYGSVYLHNFLLGCFAKGTCGQAPQGQISSKRPRSPSWAAQRRSKEEEGKHEMSTLPSSPSPCPSFLSENTSKGSQIYFPWNLKWSGGLHHWAAGWGKGKAMPEPASRKELSAYLGKCEIHKSAPEIQEKVGFSGATDPWDLSCVGVDVEVSLRWRSLNQKKTDQVNEM